MLARNITSSYAPPTMTDKSRKTGLCLAGGGITGAMYEVGVLAALEEKVDGFETQNLDVIVGAASGAPVAVALAGGVSATRLYRALLDPADDFFPLKRQHLLRLDGREFRRVASSLAMALRRSFGAMTLQPLKIDLGHELDRFYDSLPAGVFNTETFEGFLKDVFLRRGLANDFASYDRELLLIANDLDAGKRAVFGADELANVPVSTAICASIATPVLFAPVRIQDRDYVAGGVGEAGHVDLAVQYGCDWVLALNAMVPVRAQRGGVPTGHGPRSRIRDKGMLWVYNQSWRMVTEARLESGLAHYRADHPDVTLTLIEPSRDDASMFMYSPMNFAARRMILEDGYRSTALKLRDPDSALRKSLAEIGWTTEN